MSHPLQRSLGQRVSQTVSSVVTEYLLDMQPGLYRVLSTDDGSSVNRFLHDPEGIHAQKDAAGNWDWMLKDGLGSVREVGRGKTDKFRFSDCEIKCQHRRDPQSNAT